MIRPESDNGVVAAPTRPLGDAERLTNLSQVAGRVAHDLNNMLVLIQSYAEYAAEVAPENEALQSHVAQILSASRRAVGLTRQLAESAQ